MDREESDTPTYALNSTLIGTYKGNVLGFMRAHTFVHPDIFVRRRTFGFERTPCFSRKSTQIDVHEAPDEDQMFRGMSYFSSQVPETNKQTLQMIVDHQSLFPQLSRPESRSDGNINSLYRLLD